MFAAMKLDGIALEKFIADCDRAPYAVAVALRRAVGAAASHFRKTLRKYAEKNILVFMISLV